MTSSHPRPVPCQWFSWLAAVLDRRAAPRLALLFLGAVLVSGRRTVTSWIRAAELGDEFESSYTAVAAANLARIYVQVKDLPGIDPTHRPEFRTKLVLAVELLRWARPPTGCSAWPHDMDQVSESAETIARSHLNPVRTYG